MILALCWFAPNAPLLAQDTTRKPVSTAWTTLRPLVFAGAHTAPQGAMVDLAEELAREVGFRSDLFKVDNYREWGQAQSTGRSEILPLITKLPGLVASNVFSDRVTQTHVRLAVTVENELTFDPSDLTGATIGVTSPGTGSDPALLPGARLINYPTIQAVLVGLLAGEVDAISSEEMFVFQEARAARLDDRISFVGPPLTSIDRFVAIHESRADLLEPINAALARMQADGRISEILQRNNVLVPPAPPNVLSVGVTNFPPSSIHNADGSVGGFSVEVLRDIAELAGLKIEFQPISPAEFGAGPTADTYDMLAMAGINEARRQKMDFTLPIQRLSMNIFTRSGDSAGLSDLDSLGTRKVGVGKINVAHRVAKAHGGLDLHPYASIDASLQALISGDVDAILYSKTPFLDVANRLDLTDKIEVVTPPFEITLRAIALRFGLGQVRTRLDSAIKVYLISDDFAAIRQKYYGEPFFWTTTRIYSVFAVALALLLALTGYVVWQRQRQKAIMYDIQQRDLEREQAHSEKLGGLITELERSNRELDEFAYTASHDLKEPLRGISINAAFLAKEDLSQKGQSRVERMVSLAARMDHLVSDLLYFSRLGRGEKVMKDINTKHVIDGVRRELAEWIKERNGNVQFAGDLPWVHGEHSNVQMLFRNLIVNALKYNDSTPKTALIGFDTEVEVNGTQMRNVFWVRDNGIGIADKNREKIFAMFQRLNTEQAYGPGTGAGLSLVRKIIAEYGGAITLVSRPGHGTTFYFALPLAKSSSPLSTASGASSNA
ncbi:MAG: transporter substrate-binding domain-containing protein [Sedimentitalea sp.]